MGKRHSGGGEPERNGNGDHDGAQVEEDADMDQGLVAGPPHKEPTLVRGASDGLAR